MTKIREIFSSIQGEGPYVGYKQLFIRFCGCNLKCKYCDTDYTEDGSKDYSVEELLDICGKNLNCHSVSLTGGEPLLHADFIKEFASQSILPVYLETNATLPEKLIEVIEFVKYVSADIKLPSSTGSAERWEVHDKFFKIASEKILFAKVVFDENITDYEVSKITELSGKYNIELILQPMMKDNTLMVNSDFISSILDRCLAKHKKTRLIPQTHKFINVI